VDVAVEEVLSHRDVVVALHGVQDPGNVGTIVRSAHAFGAGVVLTEGCADLYNPKTVRATMGSIFHAPVAREVEVLPLLERTNKASFTTAASVASGGEAPGFLSEGRQLIVVGAEGRGLPQGVILSCGRRVTIPCLAPSLNAAVAASILLHEAFERRDDRVLP
jgi:TrmH family RNA methyltransferase